MVKDKLRFFMRFFVLAFLGLAFLITAPPARAEDNTIYQCGEALKAEGSGFNTDPGERANFCDIYSRQLAYGEEKKKFREMLIERQEKFVVPRKQAYANYEKNLDARWKANNQASAAASEAKETAGPSLPGNLGNE